MVHSRLAGVGSRRYKQVTERDRPYTNRRGRPTPAQARALASLAPAYCLAEEQLADLAQAFGRRAPLLVEIGFGNGDALLTLAASHPSWNCLGIDLYRPGIGALLNACEQRDLGNIRVAEGDARELLPRLPQRSVQRFCVYFPDPWPKQRHHKRRLLNAAFVALLGSRLESGGVVQAATDWQPYAEQMLEVLENEAELRNVHGVRRYAARDENRPVTRFEARGAQLGHEVWDLEFERI
jgi:tRNA (guanine-N7-)-methyltransferase